MPVVRNLTDMGNNFPKSPQVASSKTRIFGFLCPGLLPLPCTKLSHGVIKRLSSVLQALTVKLSGKNLTQGTQEMSETTTKV